MNDSARSRGSRDSLRTAPAYAAVDLGATSGRVVLAVPSEGQMWVVHRFANTPLGDAATLHWNTDHLFQETIVGLGRARHEAESFGGELSGIGIDSWGVDYGLLKGDALAAPVRHYRRMGLDAMYDTLRVMGADQLYGITGVLEQPINTLVQLHADLNDGLLAAVDHLLPLPDLWVYWMTGRLGTEPTIASTTQLFDARDQNWSAEIISEFALPRHIFPDICETGSVAAVTTPWLTEKIGARLPVPVFRVGSHDTSSAFAVSQILTGARSGLVSSGSWTLVAEVTPEPVLESESRTLGFTNEKATDGRNLHMHNLHGLRLLEECIREEAKLPGGIDVTTLVERARDVAQPAEFDLAAPALLASDGIRTVVDRLCEEAGFAPPTDLRARARAIFESIATAVATSISHSATPEAVSVVGGGSRNDLLCELIADRTGMPVIAGPAEAAALGNILVQALGHGQSPVSAMKNFVGTTVTYQPTAGPHRSRSTSNE